MSLEVIFWDVQHGHATYVKTPNNRHIVIDLGTGDYSENNIEFSPLQHLKKNYNVKKLDFVIITHPHLDHIDDILNFDDLEPTVLLRPSQITNKEVMEGIRERDRDKFEKYCEINNRYNTPAKDQNSISNPNNWGEVNITSFSPNSCPHENFNNHSIITVVEYANAKIVIPGDNEICSFEELLGSSRFKAAVKDADILLAPHHGRKSGYNSDFVDLVNPCLTIVSDGRHCDTSANDRYSQKSRGMNVFKRGPQHFVKRKCLTTNSDGEVYVKIEKSIDQSNKNYISVLID